MLLCSPPLAGDHLWAWQLLRLLPTAGDTFTLTVVGDAVAAVAAAVVLSHSLAASVAFHVAHVASVAAQCRCWR